jgi:hypothetical protein
VKWAIKDKSGQRDEHSMNCRRCDIIAEGDEERYRSETKRKVREELSCRHGPTLDNSGTLETFMVRIGSAYLFVRVIAAKCSEGDCAWRVVVTMFVTLGRYGERAPRTCDVLFKPCGSTIGLRSHSTCRPPWR